MKPLDWIRTFRDSSVIYSKKYLELYHNYKIEDNTNINDIKGWGLNVFRDRYFYSNKSGFDALKNSGYLSKIQTTKLEDFLNAYYFKVDRIIEQEKSMNAFIESMQISIYEDNTAQEFYNFRSSSFGNLSIDEKNKLKQLYNHPSISGANMLNTFMIQLSRYYNELQQEAEQVITEINAIHK